MAGGPGPPAEGDEELLQAFVRSADRSALETLLRRHEQKIINIARRILGNREDALDAVQEVFLSVFRRASAFEHRSSFSTWLYRLTVNACYDIGRKNARRPVPLAADAAGETAVPDTAEAAGAAVDVQRALASLPVEQRTAVVLKGLAALSYEEIATITGVPEGTVKSRIARGRIALANILAPAEPAARSGRLNREKDE